jgi:hypothetical protein
MFYVYVYVCVCVCVKERECVYRYKPRLTRGSGHLSYPLPPTTAESVHTHTHTHTSTRAHELGVKGWAVEQGEKYSRAPHIYTLPPAANHPFNPTGDCKCIYLYTYIHGVYDIILSSSRVIISYLSFSYFLRII